MKRSKKERHVCRSFFCSAPCPALRSVPLSGIEIVTLRFSPLFRRFAPYESLYLHQRFELRLEAIQKRAARLPLFFCFTPALLLSCPVTDHSLSKYRRNDSYSQRIHAQFRIISDKLIASACHKVIAAMPRIGYFDLRAIRIARVFVSALVFVRSFSA